MELRTERILLKDVLPDKARELASSLGMRADDIPFVRKGIPIDPDHIEIKEGERAAIRFITTPRLDRDGEILIPHGAQLDDFRQSPSVLYAHDYKALPIGRDDWIKVTKKGILAKTQYADHAFAEDVWQCVKGGFLNSNSVGFIPIETIEQGDSRTFSQAQALLKDEYGIPFEESRKAKNIYTRWILLEHSDVPVASNAQALNIAVAKGLNINGRLAKDLGIKPFQPHEAIQKVLAQIRSDLLSLRSRSVSTGVSSKVKKAIRNLDLEDIIKHAVREEINRIRGKLKDHE